MASVLICPYCHAGARQDERGAVASAYGEPAGAATIWLLAALLHVRPNELLGVLLEHLVDLVENGVHVVGELFVPLLDFLGTAGLGLLGLLGAPRGLPLTACVLRCHVTTSVSPNAIVTRGSPAQSRQPEIVTPAGGFAPREPPGP